jgi:hypothetical protein
VNGTQRQQRPDEVAAGRDRAATSAAERPLTWTTVPPAVSAPIFASQPPPHPVRHRAVDDQRPQRDEGILRREIRSTMAPEMRAAVMMQNVLVAHEQKSLRPGWTDPEEEA